MKNENLKNFVIVLSVVLVISFILSVMFYFNDIVSKFKVLTKRGNTQECPILINGRCFTKIEKTTPINEEQCKYYRNKFKIKGAICSKSGENYSMGAVAKCGGPNNMPSYEDWEYLATHLYNIPKSRIVYNYDYKLGGPIHKYSRKNGFPLDNWHFNKKKAEKLGINYENPSYPNKRYFSFWIGNPKERPNNQEDENKLSTYGYVGIFTVELPTFEHTVGMEKYVGTMCRID